MPIVKSKGALAQIHVSRVAVDLGNRP